MHSLSFIIIYCKQDEELHPPEYKQHKGRKASGLHRTRTYQKHHSSQTPPQFQRLLYPDSPLLALEKTQFSRAKSAAVDNLAVIQHKVGYQTHQILHLRAEVQFHWEAAHTGESGGGRSGPLQQAEDEESEFITPWCQNHREEFDTWS